MRSLVSQSSARISARMDAPLVEQLLGELALLRLRILYVTTCDLGIDACFLSIQ
jgi:hypothetical protein